MYLLSFYVPSSHLESVKRALFERGAGEYKHYDQACWQVKGEGQFRPLADSQSYIGKIGQLEQVSEYKVEIMVAEAIIKPVIAALKLAHPYEEPAYHVVKHELF